jgi:hypothetical protein
MNRSLKHNCRIFKKQSGLIFLLILWVSALSAQDIKTPLQKNNYSKLSSYDELSAFVKQLDASSDLLSVEIAGKSIQGRNIYAMKFSSSGFGKSPSKIRVLIFAQQHGNEPSGKEGAMLLANELVKPENRYLFDRVDFLLVPQVNPDGSEAVKRRNGNEMDLNRNHLILTEPETLALHRLFDQYLFDVTMDVHEYSPYGETWKKYGYRDNTDELLGTSNNLGVSKKIRDMSDLDFLPFMKRYLDDRHFTNFIYTPGGPPEIEYIRRSTFDINDGRQSFAIENAVSFIMEGINGENDATDKIQHRAEGQMSGMRGLLEYSYQHCKVIKETVRNERKKLIHTTPGELVSIQSEHIKNGEKLYLPVYSYFSKTDSVIVVNDYRPVVSSLYDVKKPKGYLVPKQLKEIAGWATRHELTTETPVLKSTDKVEQYKITSVDSIDFEGDKVVNPSVTTSAPGTALSLKDYIYIPTAQLKGNLIIIALEPKSMLGLVTYKEFAHLLKAGEEYPILRVTGK